MLTLPVIMAASIGVVLIGAVVGWLAFQLGKRREQQAVSELVTLNEIGLQLLRSKLDVDDLCELVYQRARHIVPSTLFQVGLFEEDAYLVKVWIKDGERQPQQTFPRGGRTGIVGWVREHGQALLVRDFDIEGKNLPTFPSFDLDEPPRSGLFVPLIAGTSTIGIIAIQSDQPERFGESHQRLLTALANQAAWAIRNAQLYEHARRRADQLDLIHSVSSQVSAIQPLPDLFKQIATLVKRTFGYYNVCIFVLQGDRLVVGAGSGDALGADTVFDLGKGLIGWAAAEGDTALSNDVRVDDRYIELPSLSETRSEVSLPLRVEDRVLGVLDVQSDRVNAFQPDDVSLLESLAAQIALAIEQAKTYAAERRLARRLEALVQVNQAVVSELNLDDLLERQVQLISETFGFERVHIFVSLGDMLVFRSGTGSHSVRWLIDDLTLSIDDPGLIPRAARTGKAQIVDDIEDSQDFTPGSDVEETRSEMAIPIMYGGRVLGVLDVQSTETRAFAAEEHLLAQSLADSVAVAIRNAALYANERHRRNLADTLREISAKLAAELDLDRVITGVMDGLRQVVTLNTVAIAVADEALNLLTVYSTTGSDLLGFSGFRMEMPQLNPDAGDSIDDWARQQFRQVFDVPGDHPVISAGLSVGGTLIGYIIADQPPGWPYTGSDYEVVAAFANQAAIAISNARLVASQKTETYITTALLQVAEAVNVQGDAAGALDTIARLSVLLFGFRFCLILRWLPDEESYLIAAQCCQPSDVLNAEQIGPIQAESDPLLDLLRVSNRTLEAGPDSPLPVPAALARVLPASSIQCVPLRTLSGIVGVLIVDSPDQPDRARPKSILTGIAHQATSVIETANLQSTAMEREKLEQELEVARQIQTRFIPEHAPEIPGWQFSAVWKAARQVSGDFYDFIHLPDDRWGLAIADVADKGMPAALFMAVSQTLLRAAALTRKSPAETLVHVNRLLVNTARTDLFVTVFYTIWDPSTGKLSYASGGHNPALLIRDQGARIEELRCDGIALGVLPGIELEEREIQMQPGDVLVAYTDGVNEAMQTDYTEWGMDRFKETLLASGGENTQTMVDHLLQTIADFVGDAPRSDDLTLWMLKRE